tara:strand:+ start:1184 stop:1465 length:282 start_codon:yes stop_codon:yes gene_type:complete
MLNQFVNRSFITLNRSLVIANKLEGNMALSRSVVDALPEKDREELACWAAMAGKSPEAYLEACIKKGHAIIGRQILDTPTFRRTPYKPVRATG